MGEWGDRLRSRSPLNYEYRMRKAECYISFRAVKNAWNYSWQICQAVCRSPAGPQPVPAGASPGRQALSPVRPLKKRRRQDLGLKPAPTATPLDDVGATRRAIYP